MEIRAYRLDVRETGDTGTFTGYASVFGNVDSYGTVVDPGAYKKTLKDQGGEIPLVYFHIPERPVGMVAAKEDAHGLLVEGEIDLGIPDGQLVYSGLRRGYIDRMSVGFNVITEAVREQIPHYKEIRLWEVSLVTRNFAANDQALVTDVRAACRGLQRVNDVIKRGAAEELRGALLELRTLLAGAEPGAEIGLALAEGFGDLRALIVSEGPSMDTPADEPPIEDEPGDHSGLLDELRAIGRQLENLSEVTT